VHAHIPDSYIHRLSARLDIYRQISEIRSQEDAIEILNELTDRFGEPPASVKGLIDVGLIRSEATAAGIYEIKQQSDTILIYKHGIDQPFFLAILKAIERGVMLNSSTKPYVSIKLFGKDPILQLKKIFANIVN
jgi:transcription-repair coupling factor (superfamily II helicase)